MLSLYSCTPVWHALQSVTKFHDSSGPCCERNWIWWQVSPFLLPHDLHFQLSLVSTFLQRALYSASGNLRLTKRPNHFSYLNKLLVGKAVTFGIVTRFAAHY